jgi:AraC family transcriptional regulator
LHSHESAYLCLKLGADFEESAPGHHGQAVVCGAVAAHPQGAAHANVFGEQGGRCLSVFAVNARDRLWARAVADRHIIPQAGTQPIRQALDAIRSDGRAPDAADLLIVEEALHDILHRLACRHGGAADDSRAVGLALHALRDAYADPWTLEALARAAGRHPTHLARQVMRVTGLRLGDHLRRRRVAVAMQALRLGDNPVAEVAHECGFADQAHLTRWMKRLTGLTPGSVRAGRSVNTGAPERLRR